MTLIRTSLLPLRRSLFAALGLAACTPGKGESDSDPSETSSASTSTSTSTSASSSGGSTGTSVSATDPSGSGTDSASGSSTSGTSTGTSTDPTVTTGAPPACEGSLVEIMQANVDPPTPSGFVQCDTGIIHRPEPVACKSPITPSSCPADASDLGTCKTDADCTEKPFGSCQINMTFGGINPAPTDTCGCVYGCETDADCGDGMVCRCAGEGLGLYTECIPATCKDDSECPGEVCGFAPDICAPGVFFSHCTTPEDTCQGDATCPNPPCVFNVDLNHWACADAVCGRPFLVDDEAVTAASAARDDWRALLSVPAAAADLRPRLAAHWTQIGLYEHASVASFARWILQLLALGAPAELVAAAQRALADEVEHARLCFGLASLYQGTGVGPSPLPRTDAPVAAELGAILEAVIHEACVGETLSALEAQEAAARAEDPALRRVLAQIAADEQRHAELGWRFVRWALDRADADLRARADAAFVAAFARVEATITVLAADPGAPELRVHGVVDAPLRAALWREGLRGLVRPAAAALAA